MKARPPLPEGPFLVAGLARSGTAAALALRARGEAVVGVDAGRPRDAGRLRDAGVEVHTDAAGTDLLARVRTLVKSPGVPPEAPVVAAAPAAGVAVLGELELGWRLVPNEFIAVTGTNGKTTTAELLGHVHRTAGLPVAVAGNVGTPVTSLAGSIPPAATVVCETSSFQLEDTIEFAPEAAVLLNVAPDHLDRHGTLEAYVAAKLEAFARQGRDDVAVLPAGFDAGEPGGEARRVTFGPAGAGADLEERDGWLRWRGEPLVASAEIRMPGAHNRANAMAAAAACLARGIAAEPVRQGLRTFAGVPHRLERVAERGGVVWVNDSKATNVASTVVALEAFEGGVHLVLGGTGKGQDFAPLRDRVAERCAAVYLIGEAAAEIAAALGGVPVPARRCGDLGTAARAAGAAARPGDVVLLSPACASFDQFRDYEARGECFRRLAERA